MNVILRDISLLCALERFCLLKAFSVLLNSFILISIKEEQKYHEVFLEGIALGAEEVAAAETAT